MKAVKSLNYSDLTEWEGNVQGNIWEYCLINNKIYSSVLLDLNHSVCMFFYLYP